MTESIAARLIVQISANTAAFNNALAISKKELSSFQSSVQGISKSLQTFGLGFGLVEVVGAVKAGINTLAEFEQQVATVASITGASGKELDALRKSAIDLGASTKFTAKEVAELQTEFGRLGFSTQEILQATDATLSLSAATGESLAKSADIAGSTLRAFGKDASETSKVADIMAESFNASALGLDNYGEAIKYVAPIAASANISLEETTALLGTLADNGIRGSMAGTSLRKIISDLGTANGTLSERLKEVAARGLSQADAMDEVGRTAYASLLILAKNTEKTEALTKSLKDSAGAAKEAADIMGDNLQGDLDRLSSAYDSLVLSGGAFTDILREMAQAATVLIDTINEGSGLAKLAKFLVQYSLNLYTISKAINAAAYAAADLDEKIEITTRNLNRAKAAADADAIKEYTEELKNLREEVNKQIKSAYEHRQAAIQSGDAEGVKKYTQEIADLTAKYGLLRDKAIEFREELDTQQDFAGVTVDTYQLLQRHLADLNAQFEASDLADKERLAQIGQYIIATREEIAAIDALREAEKKKNEEKRKSITLYDAERASILGIAEAFKRNEEETRRNQETIAHFLDSFRDKGSKLANDIKSGKVGIPDGLRKQIDSLKTNLNEAQKTIVDFTSVTTSLIIDFANIIGEGFVTGFDDFGDKVLGAVASFAQQFGALLIAMGVAKTAFETSLTGPQLIIAGAALVAAGAAVKAHLSKQKNVTKGISLTGGGGGSSTARNAGTAGRGDVQDLTLSATAVLKGQDIYLAFKNYEENRKYTAASVKTVVG